jgi:hypothetical protein
VSENLYSAICKEPSGGQAHKEVKVTDVNAAVRHLCEGDNELLLLSRKITGSDKWYPIIEEPMVRIENIELDFNDFNLWFTEGISWFKFRRTIKKSNLNARVGWFSVSIPIDDFQTKLFSPAAAMLLGEYLNVSVEERERAYLIHQEEISKISKIEPVFEDLRLIDLPEDFECNDEIFSHCSTMLCKAYRFIPYLKNSDILQILPEEVLDNRSIFDIETVTKCKVEQVRCSDSSDVHKGIVIKIAAECDKKENDSFESLLEEFDSDFGEPYKNPESRLNKIWQRECVGWDISYDCLNYLFFKEKSPLLSLSNLLVVNAMKQVGHGIQIVSGKEYADMLILKEGNSVKGEPVPARLLLSLTGLLGTLFGLCPFTLPPQKGERFIEIGEDTYKLSGENSLNEYGIELTVKWEKLA